MQQLEPWIETFSGNKMYFLDPKEDMINIKDIAHSLSLQCRFSGHTKKFYSVAEHCVRVSQLLYEMTQNATTGFQGLLHDSSEAYLLDVPSPIKQYLTGYYEIEDRLLSLIFKHYGVPYPFPREVKEVDTVMLKNEARHLLPSKGRTWIHNYPTSFEYYAEPFCMRSEYAERVYLSWFNFLEKETNAVALTA